MKEPTPTGHGTGGPAGRRVRRARRSAIDGDDPLRLLVRGTPGDVLRRIVPGDPLGVRAVVAGRLRARRLLLDPDQVALCAYARCAREGRRLRGRPDLDAWLSERVDQAADDVARRELGALRSGAARRAADDAPGAHADLARPLGIDSRTARLACARFNQLPETERDVFFELFVEGATLDDVARRRGVSVSELGRAARRGLEALVVEGEA